MAESTTIARPYAEAIFGIADAAGTLAKWSQTLAQAAEIARNPDMLQAMGNPGLSTEQIYGLFAAAAGNALFAESQNLIRVLIENRRLALLPEIHEQYEQLKNEREGVIDAHITSAYPLEGETLAALVADLQKRFGRKIQPNVSVDPELIGGARVQVGDQVIDGSVRGKLTQMVTALKGAAA